MFCPECGYKELIETDKPMTEEFKGEQITVEGITRFECPQCGEYVIFADQGIKLSEILYEEYRKRLNLLFPSEIKAIRKKYRWTQVEFEKILGVSAPTVSRWESNRIIQTKVADNLMRAIRQDESFAEELAQRAGVKIPEPALA